MLQRLFEITWTDLLSLLELLGNARWKHLEEQRVALPLLAFEFASLLSQIRGVHL